MREQPKIGRTILVGGRLALALCVVVVLGSCERDLRRFNASQVVSEAPRLPSRIGEGAPEATPSSETEPAAEAMEAVESEELGRGDAGKGQLARSMSAPTERSR